MLPALPALTLSAVGTHVGYARPWASTPTGALPAALADAGLRRRGAGSGEEDLEDEPPSASAGSAVAAAAAALRGGVGKRVRRISVL